MNFKKIIIITLISLFAIGIMMSAAEASHTFKKGGYKMKVTDKQYKKLKKSSPYSDFFIQKKVGTKKVNKKVKVKTRVWRYYYDSNGEYTGCDIFDYNNKYFRSSKYTWCGATYKTVKHYRADGTLKYEDEITYSKFKYKTKKNIWMLAGKDARYGDSKIHVELYDFKPY